MIPNVGNERRNLVALLVAGALLRLAHILTSIGSADSLTWFNNVEAMERFGVLRAYLYDPGLNHPPLALWIAHAAGRLAAIIGVEFPDVFRALQTLADLVTTLALARIGGSYAAGYFILSPAAIFVSGFHCQSDPLMMMFVVIAVVAAMERRPLLAGSMIGAAFGIKVIALIAAPLLLLAFRGRARLWYLLSAVGTGLLIFAPALAATGPVVLKNVFGYTGLPVSWGFLYVLRSVAHGSATARQILTFTLLGALALLWLAEWLRQRRAPDPMRIARVTGTAFLLVLFFAPGFGVQYLFWPLPFLALLLRRPLGLVAHGVIGAFLFVVYTVWSDGWPWWFARGGGGLGIIKAAAVVWATLGMAAAWSLWSLYRKPAGSLSR